MQLVIVLSEAKKDYSDYLKHLSNVMSYSALLTGFILTVFTLLLTLLPTAFVAILFYLFLLYGLLIRVWGFRWVKQVPPRSWKTRFLKGFFILAILFFGFLIPLLFMIWGFFLLALIMGSVWVGIFAFYLIFDRVHIGPLKQDPE
jgi:hypothetical protein